MDGSLFIVKDSKINEKNVSNLLSDCTPFSLSFRGFAPQNGTVHLIKEGGFLMCFYHIIDNLTV
jgi:hypothetical protein